MARAASSGADAAGAEGGRSAAGPPAAGEETIPSGIGVRLRSLWRFLVVLAQFAPLAIALLRDRRRFLLFGGRRRVDEATRRERAEFLLETFLDLGPAYVKLGQILSTRPDVLPAAYVSALSRLQDDVPPEPWSAVEPLLSAELGPVEAVFDEFDTDPISGASLGQVYTARLDGDPVAVKVLRPGVRERVEADLRVIRTLEPLLTRFAPPGQAFTMENLADEFTRALRAEMDYAREAENVRRIRANFADDPDITVPAVYDEYSTDRVVTMAYVEGVKIDRVERIDAMGVDRDDLVRRLEEAYLEMIVEDGLFHADPHPGNLAVQPDGTLVFYDFGIVGRLSQTLRDRLLEFYVAAAAEDVDALIDAFVEMGALDPGVDRALMREAFEVVIEGYRGGGYDEERIRGLVSEFQGTMYEFPLRLPQDLALLVRVSTVLEGVARTLAPEFDFVDVVEEYVADRGYDDAAAEEVVESIREGLRESAAGLVTVPPQLERVLDQARRERLTVGVALAEAATIDRIGRALSLGLVLGASLTATTILVGVSEPPAAAVAAGLSTVAGVWLWRTLRRRSGTTAAPEFTRYEIGRGEE